MDIVKIKPIIQNYAWGNNTFIPGLLGIPSTLEPCAELWFGTHKGGESTVSDTPGTLLGDYLLANAESFLGESHISRFGKDLPLLLKVLAIEKPLSIQCHPNREQAQTGYAAELPLHETLNRDLWNYKDPQQKAEVLYALTPVTAMCGFRPLAQLVRYLQDLIPYQYPLVFPFLVLDAPKAIKEDDNALQNELLEKFFHTLYTMEPSSLQEMIMELTDSLAKKNYERETSCGSFLTPYGITMASLEQYPQDPGLFAPFFLNVVHLLPNEAIFLEPGTLHAYVRGNGIELMSNSDNVLRGGLTHKKVDVEELLKILSIHPTQPAKCPQIRDSYNRLDILTPTEEFMLSYLPQGSYLICERKSIELFFCVEGTAMVQYDGKEMILASGECCVIPFSVASYQATVEGRSFCASVPA
jgi:mannose-6-phosphate isomerase